MSGSRVPNALFSLGRIVVTANARCELLQPEILAALRRHQAGDWEVLDDNNRHANDRALTRDGRLLSVYYSEWGFKFWVITEADRSVMQSTCNRFLRRWRERHLLCHFHGVVITQMPVNFHCECSPILVAQPPRHRGNIDAGFD